MNLRENYDWVVFGEHLGALLSACVASKLGMSVLVLPLGPGMSWMTSETGQSLDPEPNYLLGLNSTEDAPGILAQCLGQLDPKFSERLKAQSRECWVQVITPQTRLVLASPELDIEIQREFGKVKSDELGLSDAIRFSESHSLSYWKNLPKKLFLSDPQKRSAEKPLTLGEFRHQLSRTLNSEHSSLIRWISSGEKVSGLVETQERGDFAEICSGFWYGLVSGLMTDPTLFDLLHLLSVSRSGGSFQGGLTSYREYLIDLAKELGAHIPKRIECRRIFIEKGKFVGLQISGQGSMISSPAGILGCSVDKAYERMSYSGKSRFQTQKKGLEPDGWRFTIALTVHREAVPPGMRSRAIWQEKDAPPLEIEVLNPVDYQVHEPENQILHLRTILPFTEDTLQADYQRVIAARMLRQARELLPFLEYHVIRIYPNFKKGQIFGKVFGTSNQSVIDSDILLQELKDLYGFSSLDAIPDNLKVFSGSGLGSRLGIEGLYVSSDESYPELGSLGPTLAALEAVSSVAGRSGLSGPFV